jgi:hypothetical protein
MESEPVFGAGLCRLTIAEVAHFYPQLLLHNDEPIFLIESLKAAGLKQRITIIPYYCTPSLPLINPPTMRRKATFTLLQDSLQDENGDCWPGSRKKKGRGE